MKITKIATLILAFAMTCALFAACGNKANKQILDWVDTEGKAWGEAQAAFDDEYAQAVANSDQNAVLAALNTIIEATKDAKASLEKIDRDKLSDGNKNSYDQNLNNLTGSLTSYETSLAQYQSIFDNGNYGGEEGGEGGGEEGYGEEGYGEEGGDEEYTDEDEG